MMVNLIRLIDTIVGNEPMIDFKIKFFDPYIMPIEKYLIEIRGRVTEKENSDASKLHSFISLITAKWKGFHAIWEKENSAKKTKYLQKKAKEEEELKKNAAKEIA